MKIKTDHAITRARLFFANTVTDIAITQITIIASLTGEKLRRIFAKGHEDFLISMFVGSVLCIIIRTRFRLRKYYRVPQT
jgi:hypothetical protein